MQVLRKQGVAVQLLVGGQISQGWGDLSANPEKAAANALVLMKKYDCGIEIDCEGGGDSAGIIKFIQLCAKSKPNSTYMSMDVAGASCCVAYCLRVCSMGVFWHLAARSLSSACV